MEVLEVLNRIEKTQWALNTQGSIQRHEGCTMMVSSMSPTSYCIFWFIATFLNENTISCDGRNYSCVYMWVNIDTMRWKLVSKEASQRNIINMRGRISFYHLSYNWKVKHGYTAVWIIIPRESRIIQAAEQNSLSWWELENLGKHSCSVTLEQPSRPKSPWGNGLAHLSPITTAASKVQRRGEEIEDFRKLSQPSSSASAEEELMFYLA